MWIFAIPISRCCRSCTVIANVRQYCSKIVKQILRESYGVHCSPCVQSKRRGRQSRHGVMYFADYTKTQLIEPFAGKQVYFSIFVKVLEWYKELSDHQHNTADRLCVCHVGGKGNNKPIPGGLSCGHPGCCGQPKKHYDRLLVLQHFESSIIGNQR